MTSRTTRTVAGWGLFGGLLLTAIIVVSSTSCNRDSLTLPRSSSSSPEQVIADLKDHQQRIDKATEDMLKRIQEYNASRKPGERTVQFSEVFGQDFSDQQRDVLNSMIKDEKDVSYRSLLQQIVADRDSIQNLQERVMHLEQSLPDQFVVAKKGDRQRDLAMRYLTQDARLDEAKAKSLLSQVDTTDELIPGNQVWFSYDQQRDTFRTYVTQGEAGRTPLAVRRAMQHKLIGERDQALMERDQAAAARDEAQRSVNDLQVVKSNLETNVADLQETKADLEDNVEKLSNDLSFRQNSLFYHAANEQDLKKQGVLTSVLKRVQNVKPVNYDEALDLRSSNTIDLAPETYGVKKIDKVRVLPEIFREGRDFKIERSKDSGTARVVILDPDLFKGKEVLLAVGG